MIANRLIILWRPVDTVQPPTMEGCFKKPKSPKKSGSYFVQLNSEIYMILSMIFYACFRGWYFSLWLIHFYNFSDKKIWKIAVKGLITQILQLWPWTSKFEIHMPCTVCLKLLKMVHYNLFFIKNLMFLIYNQQLIILSLKLCCKKCLLYSS